MTLSFGFIKGLKVGLEYVNLDEDDQDFLDMEGYTMMTTIDIGFFRIVICS